MPVAEPHSGHRPSAPSNLERTAGGEVVHSSSTGTRSTDQPPRRRPAPPARVRLGPVEPARQRANRRADSGLKRHVKFRYAELESLAVLDTAVDAPHDVAACQSGRRTRAAPAR